jgi:hypothetical protein
LSGGQCVITACLPGFLNCNNLYGDGCEVDPSSDPNHCGGCANSCSNNNMATRTCTGGVCNGNCNSGFANCDGTKLANGCNINTNTDVNHCGNCQTQCTQKANTASVGCSSGACVVTACNAGFADCDTSYATGCETNVNSDVNHCGNCNTKCVQQANTASVGCSSGACVITACNAGFADCNLSYGDGCETNTSTDVNHCGNCVTQCTQKANTASVGCSSGACVITVCNAGFADCNHSYGDGCETTTNTDVNNCGSCGNKCTAGQSCTAGVCH